MDWAFHESQIRFDIRAERAEYERLFKHPARVLHDRLVRRGGGDRTRRPATPEWEKGYLEEAEQRRLLQSSKSPRLGQREDILLRAQNHLMLSRGPARANKDGDLSVTADFDSTLISTVTCPLTRRNVRGLTQKHVKVG